MIHNPMRASNLFTRIFSICSLFTLASAETDFNPLPQAETLTYLKKGQFSSGVFYSFAGWRCESMVYRKRIDPVSLVPANRTSFQDNNAVRCTVFTYIGQGLMDSTTFDIEYQDTLSFWESNDSLYSSGFNRFLNVFVPEGLHPSYQQGFMGNSYFAEDSIIAFPKSEFQSHLPLPAWSADCSYWDIGQTTPCKKMLVTDYRYKSETIVFLAYYGFFSTDLGWSGAPLGSAPTGTTKIQLLQSIQENDTVNFAGIIQDGQVNLRNRNLPRQTRAPTRTTNRDMKIGKTFDAKGRAWRSGRGLTSANSASSLLPGHHRVLKITSPHSPAD